MLYSTMDPFLQQSGFYLALEARASLTPEQQRLERRSELRFQAAAALLVCASFGSLALFSEKKSESPQGGPPPTTAGIKSSAEQPLPPLPNPKDAWGD